MISNINTHTHTRTQYGLGGLIDVIKMSDRDLSDLALGVDLLTLGLNLNSQDCLYAMFNSPFTDQSSPVDTQHTIPQCYLMHPPSLKPDHLSKFDLQVRVCVCMCVYLKGLFLQ